MNVIFRKLHPDAKADGVLLHAYLISNTGRSNTCLIPPRTCRGVDTGLALRKADGFHFYASVTNDLANRGLFCPFPILPPGDIKILIYNGSHESYYIRHEELIAILTLIAEEPITMVEELHGNQNRATQRPQAIHN